MNGVEIVTATQTPSGKSFALVNPTEPLMDNSDVVPVGQGPSNITGNTSIQGITDSYWVQIA